MPLTKQQEDLTSLDWSDRERNQGRKRVKGGMRKMFEGGRGREKRMQAKQEVSSYLNLRGFEQQE